MTRPSLTHLSPDATPADIVAVLRADGALIIDDAMAPRMLHRLRDEIMPYVRATPVGMDDFTGRRTTRTGALAARSAACRELILDPRLTGACEAFLLPFADRYQLHLTQLIRIMDGQGVQPLHRDRLAWGGWLRPDIEPQLNTIWAVTDFTEANGATRVVPGSNRWEETRVPDESEIGFAEMRAGSVLVYSGSVIHGGGANVSGADRCGLNITYCLGWLRQEENQYLACPPEVAKDFAPELRDLLGYAMGSYALGYFTPPLPPGEGPEVVPPEWLFSGRAEAWGDGLYDRVAARAAEGAM
ncbi:phytanoyl-CoA dioxygenase family protein [Sandaracinobacteroides saxicola]|uniref:Phytanoyl-CoA dioxygenase family protein n=1 Tax=Sandaracinobacteroides saxicola TaxID=2759707 RepID=A0A7G5ILR8_9SPHN|nr:phytanoyl-CoA dioxygenase family protein [Sandaracinobacteroides saxicola]QMW24310.1 phytanoyl-CoA dioxygenase family protein [Sandaracinobacteroides saxicola]